MSHCEHPGPPDLNTPASTQPQQSRPIPPTAACLPGNIVCLFHSIEATGCSAFDVGDVIVKHLCARGWFIIELFPAPTKYLPGLVEFTQLKYVQTYSCSEQEEGYTGAQGCTELSPWRPG